MSSKITLYTDVQLIENMKLYAKKHNTSVSKMVTQFFESILKKEEKTAPSSKTSQLRGILKGAGEEAYQAYLEKKYL
ncbi:DUF6364 family protein [Sulfurospirillum multivorans]|jgi:hypothetical protein|uniref:Antitoxin n=2 Tax=Sulfurospirillum multivorans TaxID=66821 RepID=A0AA86APZ1_SULMK|nr:DUF6364 family protein [Sulfurospirillum multivorans]AHJ14299.1 hypothetical protein SMUL_3072 [Sulfurospirillum multivorans DSM 12446]QEH07785.1 hypothetical protein SMN_3035 [Sulfurospirillum multivorans]